jgi:CheY-like chemotaxis protein/nitrogen-specific signal transduction histidine kinase
VVAWLFAISFDGLRREILERMRAVDRTRAAFLANISHEIRTPMNGVLGMTEVMLLEPLTPAQREQLSIIQRSGRALVSLINDLLDVSKMEAGKLEVERRPFNLERVLADVQGLLAPVAAQKGLTLEVRKAKELPRRCVGDGLRLSQVLTNLITNAIKFATVGSVRLEVSPVSGPERRYRFSVTDQGPGIEPEVLPKLFTAFEQGDSSTTRRYGGTGLGLALSQQLVNLMGGQIEVRSTLGKGSCFSFELRLEETDELSAEHPARRPPEPKAKAVLVVDDNPVNLLVALRLVELLGYQAEGAENGKLAIEALQRRSFALVLMDCHMPEMDGFEATERIRAMEGELSRTPIVALTASAMPDEVAACRRAGMNSVIAKPLTIEQLRDALAEPLSVS